MNFACNVFFFFLDDPKAYLIQQLEKLNVARQSGVYYPCLFDETNLNAIYGMLDPTKRGYITRDQYVESELQLLA